MATKPESRTVKKIMNFLESHYPGYWQKIHGDIYQKRGIPDILGCHRGRFISIEVKEEGNTTSALQEEHGEQIKEAGGLWCVAYSVEEVQKFMGGVDWNGNIWGIKS